MKTNVLYRKYRPKKFKDIISQAHITEVLKAQILTDSLHHAYLFSGPHGIGKTTTARVFAKAVNCLNFKKNKDVCLKCENCLVFEQGKNMDFIEIDAASNRGIDEIRNIIEQVKHYPSFLKYKIYVIDEVHMITREAFNAFLKTLEEPPEHIIFILATTEKHKLPETILSRTQIFEFKKISKEDIKQKIKKILKEENINYSEKAIDYLATIAKGSFRDAETTLNKIISLEYKSLGLENLKKIIGAPDFEILKKFFEFLIKKEPASALNLLEESFKKGLDPKLFIEDFLLFLRNMILGKYGKAVFNKNELTEEQIEYFIEYSRKIKENKIIEIIEVFVKSYKDLYQYPIINIPLEIAVVKTINLLDKKNEFY